MESAEQMWISGVLGSDSPDRLRNTLLYLIGLNLALRGGQEHYNLRHGETSQLLVGFDRQSGRSYLQYTEDVSKCNADGLQHRKLTRKHTKAFENTTTPSRCVVALYEKYISLRPQNGKCVAFYSRALKKPTDTQWYADARIGINTMSKVVKTQCQEAGLTGYYTNHSLRATAATRMYAEGLSEQVICEKTGHRSDAVRSYKRTSTVQEQEASDAVQGALLRAKDETAQTDTSKATTARTIRVRKGDVSIEIPV